MIIGKNVRHHHTKFFRPNGQAPEINLLYNDHNPQYYLFFFPVALRSKAGHGLLIHEVSRSHTATHHSR